MVATRASAVLGKYWDGYLPVNVEAIASAMGVEVRYEFMGETSGEIHLEDGRPIMRVNEWDAPVRQRFTIAHELGHYALGHLREDGQKFFRDDRSHYSMSASRLERDANHFAASILMPTDAVHYVIQNGHATTLPALTEMFGVSRAAMQYRAANLGIIER
ncbi:ImmA/IrrE family metallo-endopeptidase [Paludibacterium denitrificans]|uniref:ImmA/IrrE family metallo-endopeptidase n=1 Tax=Paludibacterium denitrificans TaxID=2675226 RepID=A0A844GEW0_9NEIS|nr:ImmA/IrrE family metallo-endopeptidase [Paludibacterium denitrificans]MTD33254.1 ImmA/IrrE family metallo-endopeptidase [Paludibacterium denitrificans]